MKKLLLVFVGLLCSVVIFAQTNFQELSLEKAREQAKTENKPIFLDCYTSWCGPCKMLAPILEDVAEELPDLKIVKVNVDEAQGIAQQYGVMSIPTVYLFDGGMKAGRFVGVKSKEEIIDFIQNA